MPNCEKYEELISSLIDGELDACQEAELHTHIENCPYCQSIYQTFSEISGSFYENFSEPPKELASGVMSTIRGERKVGRHLFVRFSALAACIALVAIAGSNFGWFSGSMDVKLSDYKDNLANAPLFESFSERAAAPKEGNEDYIADSFSGKNLDPAIYENQNPEEDLFGYQSLQEKLDILFGSSEINLYRGSIEGAASVLVVGNNVIELAELLSCSSVEHITAFNLTVIPDYTLLFDDENKLTLYFADNNEVVCVLDDETIYRAASKVTELMKYFEKVS